MYLSIIGSPACGKTTLFHAFAGVTGSSSSNSVAIIEVPDERVDRLSAVFHPKKTVYGRIEVSDMASIQKGDMKSEAVPAKQLQQMRSSDAFLVVLDNFSELAESDPVSAFHTLVSEFMLSDMIQIETRLERIKKQAGKKEGTPLEQERLLLERCLAHLEEGKPLISLGLADGDDRALRGFQFLSLKPLMAMVNCAEGQMGELERITGEIKEKLTDTPVIAACASIEADLAVMDSSDRAAFMEEYGVKESLRGRLIGLAYQTLGLISFLTVGDDECRAWPIRKGMTAQEAAGVIHTDLSDRFIRAETVAYEDFIRLGDFAACKKAGVWRLEGKQYVVQDGDIMSIRAGA